MRLHVEQALLQLMKLVTYQKVFWQQLLQDSSIDYKK